MFFILLSPPNFLDQWKSDGTQFMIDMLAAQLFAVPGLEAIRSQWDTKILKSCFKNNVKFSAADGMANIVVLLQSCHRLHIAFFLQQASLLPRVSSVRALL